MKVLPPQIKRVAKDGVLPVPIVVPCQKCGANLLEQSLVVAQVTADGKVLPPPIDQPQAVVLPGKCRRCGNMLLQRIELSPVAMP